MILLKNIDQLAFHRISASNKGQIFAQLASGNQYLEIQ